MTGALDGIVVLDLTRILAGPTATQMLGDFGATVIKIENPKTGGDDTRSWGPNYARTKDGQKTDLSAYFMCANRNKKSVSVDIATTEGQGIIRQIAARADIVIENFKPDGLKKYGLDHEALLKAHPELVYCSISGFGQTGPNRDKPGYDLMAQGYGGIMSITGEPDGQPMKVGVGIADVMCGMYATIGIMAALRHRDKTGEGQHIDVALVDTQMAWLINEGANYLTSGKLPERRGNGHPNIVPYDVFAADDGHVIIAVGNDAQFQRFCDFLELPELAININYITNVARIENRAALMEIIKPVLAEKTMENIITGLEARKVSAGPINTLDIALGSEQARAREMVINMPQNELENGMVSLLGNPLNLSRTPVTYRTSPPKFGQDTSEIIEKYTEQPAKK